MSYHDKSLPAAGAAFPESSAQIARSIVATLNACDLRLTGRREPDGPDSLIYAAANERAGEILDSLHAACGAVAGRMFQAAATDVERFDVLKTISDWPNAQHFLWERFGDPNRFGRLSPIDATRLFHANSQVTA